MLTTDFPGAYRLSASKENTLIIIIKRPDFDQAIGLLEPSLEFVKMQAVQCHADFNAMDGYFGFDKELSITLSDEVVILERPISQTIDSTTSCSLYLLFFALNYEKTDGPLIQLEINNNRENFEWSLHAKISPFLVKGLARLYDCRIRNLKGVARIIQHAQYKMEGYSPTQNLIKAELGQDGYTSFIVGNECACLSGARNYSDYSQGYTISGHNIRFISQQISVLAGLAKLSDIYFSCFEETSNELFETVATCDRSSSLPCYSSGGTGTYHICEGNYLPEERQLDVCLKRYKATLS
jgi:hypothetical protein